MLLILKGAPFLIQSGRLDSNQRPHAPQTCALPGCATSRDTMAANVIAKFNLTKIDMPSGISWQPTNKYL